MPPPKPTRRAKAKPHVWREVGRQHVELVRRVCDCGCKRQTISMVAPDGRSVGLALPSLGAGKMPTAEQLEQAATLGRQVGDLWKQFSAVFRALR